MQTLVVNIKSTSDADKIKALLGIFKAKFKVLEDLEDEKLGTMIEKTKKSKRLTSSEKEALLDSILK